MKPLSSTWAAPIALAVLLLAEGATGIGKNLWDAALSRTQSDGPMVRPASDIRVGDLLDPSEWRAIESTGARGWVLAVTDCQGCTKKAIARILSFFNGYAVHPVIITRLKDTSPYAQIEGAKGLSVLTAPKTAYRACSWFCPRILRVNAEGRVEWIQTAPELNSVAIQLEAKR